MENTNSYFPPPTHPLCYMTTPLSENHNSKSWLELALHGQQLTLNLQIGTQPVSIMINDPHFLENFIREGMNLATLSFGQQLWMQRVLQAHLYGDLPQMTSEELSALLSQIHQPMSFFPEPLRTPPLSPHVHPGSHTDRAAGQKTQGK